ncbi:MAG: hypothetical protein JKY51_10935 [Opitutaceae bacterium]|nr:hypothetical protein [Opitutaceae bacterium]
MSVQKRMVLAVVAMAVHFLFIPITYGADIDVYVVYSRKGKTLKSEIVNALNNELLVKSYNVDLLGLADYPGLQKAVLKIDQATTVIFIGNTATKYFRDNIMHGNLIIVNESKSGNEFAGTISYFIDEGKRSKKLKKLTMKNLYLEEGLAESEALTLSGSVVNILKEFR